MSDFMDIASSRLAFSGTRDAMKSGHVCNRFKADTRAIGSIDDTFYSDDSFIVSHSFLKQLRTEQSGIIHVHNEDIGE
jgi:hypothetical protein